MRNNMQRFYIKNLKIKENIFSLREKNIVYQLVKVLRTRIGMELILFDWEENIDYLCEVVDFAKKEISLKLLKKIEKNTESEFEINLFQALPNKLDKLEYIIQKWVEVWIYKFFFYRSKRSQKLSITEKKEERLNRILVEAIEQSGRNKISELILSSKVSPLENKETWNNIFLHTKNKNSQKLSEFINNLPTESQTWDSHLNIYIWPEWGFSNEEVERFEKNNFTRIHLWNRILRTETAGIVTAFTLWQML